MLKREGRMFDAIAFRKGELEDQLPHVIDIAFYIERNVYMGYENIQLNVQEICWWSSLDEGHGWTEED